MRNAVYAATATVVTAIGIAGGSLALRGPEPTSPEVVLFSRHLLVPYVRSPEAVLADRHLLVWPKPLVLTDGEAEHEAEMALIRETREEPEPEPIMVAFTDTAATPIEPLPADAGMGDGNVEAWRPLVASYFGDLGTGAVNTALCLMNAESGGNPDATNGSSGASGLMQVLPSWADHFGFARGELYDPGINLWISRELYNDGGWGHWSPYNRGECH